MLFPEEVRPSWRHQYWQGTEHAPLQKLSKGQWLDGSEGWKRKRPRERQRVRARKGREKDKDKEGEKAREGRRKLKEKKK